MLKVTDSFSSLCSSGNGLFPLALTTMTVSPNRRVIAIAERINDRPVVTIYDLHSGKRRKTLQPELIKSNEIVSLLFSSDSKYLLTQGGGPEYTLIYWSWEKGKVMANIDVKPPTGPQAHATVNQVEILLLNFVVKPSFSFRFPSIPKTTPKSVQLAMVSSKCSVTLNQR